MNVDHVVSSSSKPRDNPPIVTYSGRMIVLYAALLLGYGIHIAVQLWHGDAFGASELEYLCPIALLVAIAWLWQITHPQRSSKSRADYVRQTIVDYSKVNSIIAAHRQQEAVDSDRREKEQARQHLSNRKFLKEIQASQARKTWNDEN